MGRPRWDYVWSCPVAQVANANALMERNGYGPDNFSIGEENPGGSITHYVLSMVADDAQLALLNSVPAAAFITEHKMRIEEAEAAQGWTRHDPST